MSLSEFRKYYKKEIEPLAEKCLVILKEKPVFGDLSWYVQDNIETMMMVIGDDLTRGKIPVEGLYPCLSLLNDDECHILNVAEEYKEEGKKYFSLGKKLKKAEELLDELMKSDGFIVY